MVLSLLSRLLLYDFVQGTISFESISRPGHYLLNRNGEIFVEQMVNSNDEAFRRECSWFVRKGIFFPGFTSFESASRGGWFIRHKNRRLQLTELFSQSDRNDAR